MTQESYYYQPQRESRHSYVPHHKYDEIPKGILRRTSTSNTELARGSGNKIRRKLSYAASVTEGHATATTIQQPLLNHEKFKMSKFFAQLAKKWIIDEKMRAVFTYFILDGFGNWLFCVVVIICVGHNLWLYRSRSSTYNLQNLLASKKKPIILTCSPFLWLNTPSLTYIKLFVVSLNRVLLPAYPTKHRHYRKDHCHLYKRENNQQQQQKTKTTN